MVSHSYLPIDDSIDSFLEQLKRHGSVVLSAEPGAGKTTRIPPALLRLCNKEVWVLEPRRIAAISAAHRIAEENDWTVGDEVGYQVRFENKSTKKTKILFLTEALLLRKMLNDPELSQVDCVVLDEFHERSIHIDLALAALKELKELSRPDLKIVVMSATLNARPLSNYLGGAPILNVPGKVHPLEIHHDEKTLLLKTDHLFVERMSRWVKAAMARRDGDLLCFLPGRGEIERVKESLRSWSDSNSVALHSLHGQMGLSEQRATLAPDREARRKVILSTNMAESSLTVPGVRIVVDSGLVRRDQQNLKTGLESLDLKRISLASAFQRAGRAAREGPGFVYRAWSVHDERSMDEFESPEIFRKDLSETLLLLAGLGITHPEKFSWFEAPSTRSIEVAKNFLLFIGALSKDGSLTSLGSRLRDLPVHPRLGKLLIEGANQGLPHLSADLAALLSVASSRKIKSSAYSGVENDLLLRLEDWQQGKSRSASLDRTSDQLRRLIGGADQSEKFSSEAMAELLFSVYPDRLARRRRKGQPEGKMVGGRGVRLHPDSSVRESEFFLCLELAEGREASTALVYQAVGLSTEIIREKIEPLAQSQTCIEWDREREKFYAIESKEWRGLSISSEHRRLATLEELKDRLAEVVFSRWERLLQVNEGLRRWLDRLNFLSAKDSRFTSLSEEQVKSGLELACYGEDSLGDIEKKKLVPFFESLLSEDHRSVLDTDCPEFWVVPSGSRLRVQYSEEQGAFVEVRLQELFGLERAPTIAGQPLTLFLLAPNYRPVQVTRDLPSFWSNGYPEVRKELRLRYPKHSWPEDPLTAPPQAKGRPKK